MVGCIININNKLLLLKNKGNKYEIPEDFVKENELFKIAAIRAVKEKTGFSVVPNAMFGVYDALDRKYSERTVGIYYITHVDMNDDDAIKLINEFNSKNKDLGYELSFFDLDDYEKSEFMHDHQSIIHNYMRLLMLGKQAFQNKQTNKKE